MFFSIQKVVMLLKVKFWMYADNLKFQKGEI